MNTMKFVVVVVLFALIGSASAGTMNQTECAILSDYVRCEPMMSAECDTSTCKFEGGSCSANTATLTAAQTVASTATSGWATIETEKKALCLADADCSILAANAQTACIPACELKPMSICSNNGGTEPCGTNGFWAQTDDCISSGFMTTDYKMSGAGSIMASTVILAFIAAGLATFA